jgi:hypothetical protein
LRHDSESGPSRISSASSSPGRIGVRLISAPHLHDARDHVAVERQQAADQELAELRARERPAPQPDEGGRLDEAGVRADGGAQLGRRRARPLPRPQDLDHLVGGALARRVEDLLDLGVAPEAGGAVCGQQHPAALADIEPAIDRGAERGLAVAAGELVGEQARWQLEQGAHDLQVQRALAAEVVVDQSARHPRLGRQVGGRDGVVVALGEQAPRGREDLLAALGHVEPRPARSGGRRSLRRRWHGFRIARLLAVCQ